MNLGSVDEKAYTLFCCAKDLYLGTKHINIADLADEQLIPPKMFGIICNVLAKRRFGIGVINQNGRRNYALRNYRTQKILSLWNSCAGE